MRTLLWFKQDLRLDDHPALQAALSAECLLPVFVFDPQHGRRRRALARDKMVRYGNEVGSYVSGAAKDLSNRAYGVAKDTEGLVREQLGAEAKPL